MPGECLVAGLPIEQDLALLGQDYVAWQAEVQLHWGDQVGVAPADGSLEGVLGVLVVDDLCHCGSGITAPHTAASEDCCITAQYTASAALLHHPQLQVRTAALLHHTPLQVRTAASLHHTASNEDCGAHFKQM